MRMDDGEDKAMTGIKSSRGERAIFLGRGGLLHIYRRLMDSRRWPTRVVRRFAKDKEAVMGGTSAGGRSRRVALSRAATFPIGAVSFCTVEHLRAQILGHCYGSDSNSDPSVGLNTRWAAGPAFWSKTETVGCKCYHGAGRIWCRPLSCCGGACSPLKWVNVGLFLLDFIPGMLRFLKTRERGPKRGKKRTEPSGGVILSTWDCFASLPFLKII